MASPKQAKALPTPTYIIPSSEHELKMSYGMFNDIMRLVGDVQNASTILITDSMTRDLIVRRLFTDTKKALEKTEDLVDSFEIEILPSELDGIMAWVVDHITHFLLSTGKTMQAMMVKYKDDLPEDKLESVVASLNPSNDGSES